MKNKPAFAPGDKDMLEKNATEQDKKNGNVTKVTRLSYDEVDPS